MTKIFKSLLATVLLAAAGSANAGLMLTNPGLAMTDFHAAIDGASHHSATSLNGDVVNFTGKNGAALTGGMIGGDASTAADAWWSGDDDDFYYAGFSTNWVELHLPTNTIGFSLSLDASVSSRAWVIGVDNHGNGMDTQGNLFSLQADGGFSPDPLFNIHLGGAKQSFGFYADNSAGKCSTISKVVIDPYYWGMGDFGIHVSDDPCGQVSEPSVLMLFAAGLFGLGYARRRIRS